MRVKLQFFYVNAAQIFQYLFKRGIKLFIEEIEQKIKKKKLEQKVLV